MLFYPSFIKNAPLLDLYCARIHSEIRVLRVIVGRSLEKIVANSKDKNNPKHQAISFLARRDHSVKELSSKLLSKGHESDVVDALMLELQGLGYLDDSRYAQMMLRHHSARGQGPQKIRFLLSQKGVSNDVISACFSDFEGDWFQLACDVRQKRFGDSFKSVDAHEQFKEKSKQMRFLMTRGFEADQVHCAFDSLSDE